MASLNLSTNGSSITKSYQLVVNAPPPSGNAAQSRTYGQWAIFSVSAPLANAFQQDTGSKESVLKVQSTGEGELVDLIDEFSDGRIQFAFAKVKDLNTTLPKAVLIGWCGEGVPERTKGYFTSHLNTVSKMLHGYHVQITARSDRDLTPESVVQKVSDASGSRYSGVGSNSNAAAPPPPVTSKPAFTPTQGSIGGGAFNPLASRTRIGISKNANVDEDGWGEDAPPVTRTQLEKVQPSYQPTKVNLGDRSAQSKEARNEGPRLGSHAPEDSNVVKGAYQPIGKVDIAALRKQAQQTLLDDRPTPVKGAYEPVGKVDIAAIRARAPPPSGDAPSPSRGMSSTTGGDTGGGNEEQWSLPDRSAPISSSERITSLPKPKTANRFGSTADAFVGTRAPRPEGPGGLESKPTHAAPPIGVGRTFADQGGKTPAQLWAEKKASERGLSGGNETPPTISADRVPAPLASQGSGNTEWKGGYAGKSWAPVQITRTGQSSGDVSEQLTGPQDEGHGETASSSSGGVNAIRDNFKNTAPIESANVGSVHSPPSPPALDTSNKPNAGRGVPVPGLSSQVPQYAKKEDEPARLPLPPPQPPRSPTPPTPPATSGSPIRLAMPVGRGGHNEAEVENARDEQLSPPLAMPTRSLAQAIPHEDDLTEEPIGHDPARGAGEAAAVSSFGGQAMEEVQSGAQQSGKTAVVQYDYDKAEDNELELKEGEHVTNVEMVDENWWMGQNPRGETGLFPSNYVEMIEEDASDPTPPEPRGHPYSSEVPEEAQGATATAIYDYEASEDNELSFPEDAKITGVEFPDEDWWSGEYAGKSGLFPANYVELDK